MKKEITIVSNPVSLLSLEQMRSQLSVETKKRKLLTEFITEHMKEGVDYGVIEMTSKKTGKTYRSKPTLLKPGAEKFCSLFRIQAKYSKDDETWEMLNREVGAICIKCELFNGDVLVGEGRGVCTVAEKGSANVAIKIAKKRAKLDAVLETGGLSEFFSQDLDDMEPIRSEKGSKAPKTNMAAEAERLIANANTVDNLLVLIERIKASDKFTEAQKKTLVETASKKADAIDASTN